MGIQFKIMQKLLTKVAAKAFSGGEKENGEENELNRNLSEKADNALDSLNAIGNYLERIYSSLGEQFGAEKVAADNVKNIVGEFAKSGVELSDADIVSLNKVAVEQELRVSRERKRSDILTDPATGGFADQRMRLINYGIIKATGVDARRGAKEFGKNWKEFFYDNLTPSNYEKEARREQILKDQKNSEEKVLEQSRKNAERQRMINSNHETNSTWGQ